MDHTGRDAAVLLSNRCAALLGLLAYHAALRAAQHETAAGCTDPALCTTCVGLGRLRCIPPDSPDYSDALHCLHLQSHHNMPDSDSEPEMFASLFS